MARKTAITEHRNHSAHPPSSSQPNLGSNKAPNVAALTETSTPVSVRSAPTSHDTRELSQVAGTRGRTRYGQPDPALRHLA